MIPSFQTTPFQLIHWSRHQDRHRLQSQNHGIVFIGKYLSLLAISRGNLFSFFVVVVVVVAGTRGKWGRRQRADNICPLLLLLLLLRHLFLLLLLCPMLPYDPAEEQLQSTRHVSPFSLTLSLSLSLHSESISSIRFSLFLFFRSNLFLEKRNI